MPKSAPLQKWLTEIGRESNDEKLGSDGRITTITNDEQLARMIWQRALGYIETSTDKNGQEHVTIHLPDAKAQQFIFERREGKAAEVHEGDGLTAGQKIANDIKDQLNDLAQKTLNDDSDDRNTETDSLNAISEADRVVDLPDNRVDSS